MNRVIWLMAVANLLAAYGGGGILREGVHIIPPEQAGFLPSASILGLIVGIAVALFVQVLFIRSAIPTDLRNAARFALGTAGAALFLFLFVREDLVHGVGTFLFFVILCVRSSCWFLPRGFRMAVASSHGRLPIVEAAYYCGTILGLLFPPDVLGLMPVGWKPFAFLLLCDAGLQILVACMDWYGYRMMGSNRAQGEQAADAPTLDRVWYVRMTLALAVLTIGCQILPFTMASDWMRRAEEERNLIVPMVVGTLPVRSPANIGDSTGHLILVIFYAGVAVSAILCHWLGTVMLAWNGRATIHIGVRPIPYLILALPSLAATALAILAYCFDWGDFAILCPIAIGAALYEVLSLALIHRIAEQTGRRDLTYFAFGMMALLSAFALWLLLLAGSAPVMWLIALSVCTLLACIVVNHEPRTQRVAI